MGSNVPRAPVRRPTESRARGRRGDRLTARPWDCRAGGGAPEPAHGDGFRLLDQGANATAQGAAFSAQADDPSALHYNPAGMTQLPGLQVYAGGNLDLGRHQLHQYRRRDGQRRHAWRRRQPASEHLLPHLLAQESRRSPARGPDRRRRSHGTVRAAHQLFEQRAPGERHDPGGLAHARHQADRGLPRDLVPLGRRRARHLHVLGPHR